MGQASQADAARTLREVERVRERTWATLDRGWIGFFVFGVASLLSVPFTLIEGWPTPGTYWLIAGPVGLIVTWLGFCGSRFAAASSIATSTSMWLSLR